MQEDHYNVSWKWMSQHLATTSENIKRFNDPLSTATFKEDPEVHEWHQQLLKVTEILNDVAKKIVKSNRTIIQ
tara:strand:- start:2300 stop:2518 length:219 start_codon:yes stop_codon:yes gene_type:complete